MRFLLWMLLFLLGHEGVFAGEIDPKSRESVRKAYLSRFLAPVPPMGWTGNAAACQGGNTSLAYQQRVIDQVNFYRDMVRLPPVKLSANNSHLQAMATLISANNPKGSRTVKLSHTPDATWKCYSDLAKQGGRANLAVGKSGADAIDGYMDDPGLGNEAVGHRRWVIFSRQLSIATGDAPAQNGFREANSLGVFEPKGEVPRDIEFISWPSAGYFPEELLPTSNRWSFSVPGADFSQAEVSMKKAGNSAVSVPVKILPPPANLPPRAFIGDPTLVWEVMIPSRATGTYEVQVSNVVINGDRKSYRYRVDLFLAEP